jgi:hypothetical protein
MLLKNHLDVNGGADRLQYEWETSGPASAVVWGCIAKGVYISQEVMLIFEFDPVS